MRDLDTIDSCTASLACAALLAGLLGVAGCSQNEGPAEEGQAETVEETTTAETTATAEEERAAEPGVAEQETGGGAMAAEEAGQTASADVGEQAAADPETLLQQSGCKACHAVDQKVVGPAYSWVAHRYQNQPGAVDTLVERVKGGAQGQWSDLTGGVPMPPNPELSEDTIHTMVEWILDLEPTAPPQS